jgi:hypothetical protein
MLTSNLGHCAHYYCTYIVRGATGEAAVPASKSGGKKRFALFESCEGYSVGGSGS